MGLDISLIKYNGLTDKGFLNISHKTEHAGYWDSTRYAIRHELSKNIEFKVLKSGKDYDWEEYYRPIDFDKAYEWSNSLELEKDKEYVNNILDLLSKDENYYLDYGY